MKYAPNVCLVILLFSLSTARAQPTWVQRLPAASPPARHSAGFAFDPTEGISFLFGGMSDAALGPLLYGDSWHYDGNAWVHVQGDSTPRPCCTGSGCSTGICSASGPDKRTIPRGPQPGADATATIVSSVV